MPHRWLSAVLALALAAGCAGADASSPAPGSGEATSGTSPAPVVPGMPSDDAPGDGSATVDVGRVEPYGDVLVDEAQLTLYVFTADAGGTSACADTCADNWPPVESSDAPVAAGATRAGLLATMRRADGTAQATYDGRPLYRYSGDSAPGDALGAGLGDRWYPVRPDGTLADGAAGAADGR
jgi:predicted lipoprotein with Yx(FWY)xxD motif